MHRQVIFGTPLNDYRSPPQEAEIYYGLKGNDTIPSGPGDDIFIGGRGVDTFVFTVGDGHDVIKDYQPHVDLIDLSDAGRIDSFDDLDVTFTSAGINVDYGTGSVFLAGADHLNVEDFIL